MIMMVGIADFFGKDEWKAIFLASFLLTLITAFFLISRVLLWIALILFALALFYSGYRLFFSKKSQKYSGDDFIGMFKSK